MSDSTVRPEFHPALHLRVLDILDREAALVRANEEIARLREKNAEMNRRCQNVEAELHAANKLMDRWASQELLKRQKTPRKHES